MALKTFFFFFPFFLLFPILQTASLPNPKPFSSKPPMTLLFKTQNPKKEKKKKEKNISYLPLFHSVCVCFLSSFLIYDSFSLSQRVYLFPFFLGVCICFLSSFLISDSLSLSLCGQNNERGCDDGFVDIKSVEVSSIAENDLFFGLKPNRFGFYFLIFPVWLLRKWWRRVPFLVWNPVDLAFIFWFFDLS